MSSQQQQQKQQYSKGNNFQTSQESSVYAKAIQLTDKKQIDKLFVENSVKQYLNKLISKKTIRKGDDGFYLTIEGKGTYFYKTQREINNQIVKMFRNEIIEEKKLFDKNFESYKNKNRRNIAIAQLRSSTANNNQLIAKCSKSILGLSAQADAERETYSNALYKNAMLQAKYTMTIHGQNMNMMNIDIKMTGASQKTTERMLNHAKTMLDAGKRRTDLFAQRIVAQDWNTKQAVDKLNNKYNDKANEILRQQQQKTLDEQRKNFADFIAKEKERAGRKAAEIAANAAKTAAEMKRKADATVEKMNNTTQNLNKVSDNINQTSKDVDKAKDDFDNKNDDINKTLNDLKDVVSDLNDAVEMGVDAAAKFRQALKDAGEEVTSSLPPECLSSPIPKGCGGKKWLKVPIYNNATNKTTHRKGLKIFQCDLGGHFCAADNQSGSWGEVTVRYDISAG